MENNHGITETPQPKDPAAVRGGPGQRLYQAEPAGPGLERGERGTSFRPKENLRNIMASTA